jgi:hypothetical protein
VTRLTRQTPDSSDNHMTVTTDSSDNRRQVAR